MTSNRTNKATDKSNNKDSTVIVRMTKEQKDFLTTINPCLSKAVRECIERRKQIHLDNEREKTRQKAIRMNRQITSTDAYRMLREAIRQQQ